MRDLPAVTRVATERGTRIQPPLDESWSDIEKLRWHAAVTAYDTGLRICVREGGLSEKVGGVWRRVPGMYNIQVGGVSASAYTFDGAWCYLNGVSAGARGCRTTRPGEGS